MPPDGREGGAPGRRDDTRTRLLQAATSLFGERGFHRTQVMDIVGLARVSAGTFYRHFADKRAIFRAIAEALIEHEVAQARLAAELWCSDTGSAGKPPLLNHYEQYLEVALLRANEYLALAASGMVEAELDHARLLRDRPRQALETRLRDTGRVSADEARSLARMIQGATSELRQAVIDGTVPGPRRAARELTRFVRGALSACAPGVADSGASTGPHPPLPSLP